MGKRGKKSRLTEKEKLDIISDYDSMQWKEKRSIFYGNLAKRLKNEYPRSVSDIAKKFNISRWYAYYLTGAVTKERFYKKRTKKDLTNAK